MDRITKALLDEFIQQNGLETLPEDKAFEHFAGYLVTAGHYPDSFSTDDICVGAGGDCGIDCITFLVNGSLVTEPEEIEDLASTNGYLDITFVFTQAERSPGFETAKIGQFAFGVCDFFSDRPQLPRNDKMQFYGRIWQAILERSRFFKKGNPQCFLYYVTTGKWTDDQNLSIRRDAARKDVDDLGLFRRVGFECVDAERLQRLYRESQNAVAVEITFSERTVIPDIPGVEQAYLGLLPATEYLKLVENESQEMLTAIFYDNVRHWQEWNPVNNEIRDTLSGTDTKVLFPLLNNGVTVVARRINPTANRFLIEDYQEVSDEQLFALSDFPKQIEAYFPTFDGKRKLYYERRSRQYNSVPGIEKVRVVNMTMLVRAFASMFLKLPHRTTRNYKTLLQQIGTDIFNKEHRLEPYYVSAFAHYRLEYLFRNQTIGAILKPARYHVLLAFRLLTQPDDPPPMNSHLMEKYCATISETLWDEDKCRDTFVTAAKHVEAVASGNLHRDNIRTEPFTKALLVNSSSKCTT